jgi:hypothetical protein
VQRNKKYEDAVREWKVWNAGMVDGAGVMGRFGGLIQCLMAMARSSATGEIDADIQIALAVLLNANEVRGVVIVFWDVGLIAFICRTMRSRKTVSLQRCKSDLM